MTHDELAEAWEEVKGLKQRVSKLEVDNETFSTVIDYMTSDLDALWQHIFHPKHPYVEDEVEEYTGEEDEEDS
jgi:hypothetical protein